jgi:hypothetical protein
MTMRQVRLSREGKMLIATFGPSTGWVGKTITFENNTFVLQDHGPISASDVMQYDEQGHLVWANGGMRAWVGARVPAPDVPPSGSMPRTAVAQGFPLIRADDGRTPGLVVASMIGLALVILGLGGAIYFFAFFDTSVAVPVTNIGGVTVGGERVNNFGLMDDRRNGILFGFGAAAVGGVLMFVGRKRSPAPEPSLTATVGTGKAAAICDACNGAVQVGAGYCPHCGKSLSWATIAQPL